MTNHLPEYQARLAALEAEFDRAGGRGVELAEEAYIVLCGLVQPHWLTSESPTAVNHDGIYTDVWDELHATFPVGVFQTAAQERGEDFYHEEAGL
jgi:hypothetical protein